MHALCRWARMVCRPAGLMPKWAYASLQATVPRACVCGWKPETGFQHEGCRLDSSMEAGGVPCAGLPGLEPISNPSCCRGRLAGGIRTWYDLTSSSRRIDSWMVCWETAAAVSGDIMEGVLPY